MIPEVPSIARCRDDVRASMLGLAAPVPGQRVEVLEEITGRYCGAWFDDGRIESDSALLTSDAEALVRLAKILVADDIEAVLVYPNSERYPSAGPLPVLVDVVVADRLRPPHEVRAAAEIAGLRCAPVLHESDAGVSEEWALSTLAVNGRFGSRLPVDRVRCWLTYRGLPVQSATIERAKERRRVESKPVVPNPLDATAGDRAATAALAQALVLARGGKRKRAARGPLEEDEHVRGRGDGLRLPGL